MRLDTGYSILSVGKISAVGIRENGKPKAFIGLYVKDMFGDECVYELKVWDAIFILQQIRDGYTGMLSGKYAGVMNITKNDIDSKGWVELESQEVTLLGKIASNYNFTIHDY